MRTGSPATAGSAAGRSATAEGTARTGAGAGARFFLAWDCFRPFAVVMAVPTILGDAHAARGGIGRFL